MLWFLFCFCGSSDGFHRLRNRKYFIFRFDDHHHNKIVAISVIGCVIRMNGVPPRAASDLAGMASDEGTGCCARAGPDISAIVPSTIPSLLTKRALLGHFIFHPPL